MTMNVTDFQFASDQLSFEKAGSMLRQSGSDVIISLANGSVTTLLDTDLLSLESVFAGATTLRPVGTTTRRAT